LCVTVAGGFAIIFANVNKPYDGTYIGKAFAKSTSKSDTALLIAK
jgi:hypothetical protein